MITLIDTLFILTPFLLAVLVYLEYKANLMVTNQDTNLQHKPYTLLELREDIIKLFINVFTYVCAAFPACIVLLKVSDKCIMTI